MDTYTISEKENESFYLYGLNENLIKLITSHHHLGLSEKDLNINDSDKLFIYYPPNRKKNKFIILSKTLEDKEYIRYIFDFYTGILIQKIKDTPMYVLCIGSCR